MTTLPITLNLPERLVQTLNALATQWGVSRDVVVARMIDDYEYHEQQHLAIGQLTLKQLGMTPPPSLPIAQLRLDADDIAEAMAQTYGSDDIVEIIRQERDFEVVA